MATNSNIEWTDCTSNPIRYRRKSDGKDVWACVKVSPGCAHCYAERLALRFNKGKLFIAANMEEVEPYFSEAEAANLLKSKKLAGKRVFVGDMTDMFGEWVTDAMLDKLFAVFALRPDVTFQVLTKRAERMREYTTAEHLWGRLHEVVKHRMGYDNPKRPAINRRDLPLKHVHLGVSVEDQQRADERIPLLLQTPAAVRFLSCEPLLGPISLRDVPGLNKLPTVHEMEGRSRRRRRIRPQCPANERGLDSLHRPAVQGGVGAGVCQTIRQVACATLQSVRTNDGSLSRRRCRCVRANPCGRGKRTDGD